MVDTIYIDGLTEHTTPTGTEIMPIQTTEGTPETRFIDLPTLMGIIRTLMEADYASGKIITAEGIQELINKALTGPTINGGAALTADSDELNKLHSLDTTAAELSYVHHVTGPIQTQLDAKPDMDFVENMFQKYRVKSTVPSTTLTITEANILNGITGKYVNSAVIIDIFEYDAADTKVRTASACKVQEQTTGAQVHLHSIALSSLTAGHTYDVVVGYSLDDIAGA